MEDLREDHYLEAIFGQHSKLDNDEWMKRTMKKENLWVFSPPQIRKRLFDLAQIEERHYLDTVELFKQASRQPMINVDMDTMETMETEETQ